MNIEKTPLVTSLIRACKSADKEELGLVIKSISENGISKNDLNSVDRNGRVSFVVKLQKEAYVPPSDS